jgi:hypothetical protein
MLRSIRSAQFVDDTVHVTQFVAYRCDNPLQDFWVFDLIDFVTFAIGASGHSTGNANRQSGYLVHLSFAGGTMGEHNPAKPLPTAADRARALHKALAGKGLIPDGYLERWTKAMEEEWDPKHGAQVVARDWVDSIGHGREVGMEPTYHVRFDSKELWGDAAEEGWVVVDLFDGYLEKVKHPIPADASVVAESAAAPA